MRKYILLIAIVFAFSIVDTFVSTKRFSADIHIGPHTTPKVTSY